MKRLLFLAVLVVVATLAFAPAALAQEETVDLRGDTCGPGDPRPVCDEGNSTGNPSPSANAMDPVYQNNIIEQSIENKKMDLNAWGEVASASGDVASDAVTQPTSPTSKWGWVETLLWMPKTLWNWVQLDLTWNEKYQDAVNRY